MYVYMFMGMYVYICVHLTEQVATAHDNFAITSGSHYLWQPYTVATCFSHYSQPPKFQKPLKKIFS
jgi:hypothetical protein